MTLDVAVVTDKKDRSLALTVGTFNAKGNEAIAAGQPAQACGWFEQAVEAIQAALDATQGHPWPIERDTAALMWSNLGDAYAKCGRLSDAKGAFERSVAICPEFAMGWFNLGVLVDETTGYNGSGEVGQTGQEFYRRALEYRTVPGALNNLGNIALHEGRLDEAREHYLNALAHQWFASSYNLSLCLLMLAGQGRARWRDAWRAYEWRPQMVEFRKNDRLWRGERLRDKKIAVYLEQGLGDCVWALRWVKLAKEWGAAKVYVACTSNMAPLVRAQPWVDEVYETDGGAPPPAIPIDYVTMAGSMALYMDPDGQRRTMGQYLTVAPTMAVGGTPVYFDNPAPVPGRVGLCWSGSVDRGYQRFRDIPLTDLAPLSDVQGVEFVSLQKGKRAGDAQDSKLPIRTDLIEACANMLDTARLIASCQLVITVDTVIPHLAGALGVPTWLMNRSSSCWQWGLPYADVPGGDPCWYGTIHQFRQHTLGDWRSVIGAVRTCLEGNWGVPFK